MRERGPGGCEAEVTGVGGYAEAEVTVDARRRSRVWGGPEAQVRVCAATKRRLSRAWGVETEVTSMRAELLFYPHNDSSTTTGEPVHLK